MRNLKKVLSLLVAVAMMMSLAISAAAIFPDQDKIENTEAVDMAVALGIIKGRDTGNFDPTGIVTRAEMCKMICIILNGGNEPTLGKYNPSFSDTNGHWAESYIEYCVAQNIVAGMGDGTFDPNAGVTGTQAAKMLLVALGYDASHEQFNGINWAVKINVQADYKELYDDLSIDPNAPLSRDDAAQMIWNTLQADRVKYTYSLQTVDNQLQNMQVREDITGADHTLLLKHFSTTADATGYLTGYEWDSSKKEFKYYVTDTTANLSGDMNHTGDSVVDTNYITSTTDYTELFGMHVKIVKKMNGKNAFYGMFPEDGKILDSGVYSDLDESDATHILFKDVKYSVNYTTGATKTATLEALPVVAENNIVANTDLDDLIDGDDIQDYYSVRLLDNNDDGKVDVMVYLPVTYAQVSSVNSGNITMKAIGASITGATKATFDEDVIYDGVAVDDIVMIVREDNNAYKHLVITEVEAVNGKVTGTKGTSAIVIDGSSYDIAGDSDVAVTDVKIGNSYAFYVLGGEIIYCDTEDSAAFDKLLYVAGGNAVTNIRDEAKVYFADGTSAIITVKEVKNTGLVATLAGVSYTSIENCTDLMFTYTVKNNEYTLTPVGGTNLLGYTGGHLLVGDNSSNTVVGYISGGDSDRVGKLNLFDDTDAAQKVGGYIISDEAVIFIKYSEDNNVTTKVKVVSGATAKNYRAETEVVTPDIDVAVAATEKAYALVNSSEAVKAAVLVSNAPMARTSSNKDNYGFLLSTPIEERNVDGDPIYTFSMWTKNGEMAVFTEDETALDLSKRAVIEYTLVGSNELDSIDAVIYDGDGNLEVSLEAGDTANVGAIKNIDSKTSFYLLDETSSDKDDTLAFNSNSDTVVLYMDTKAAKGQTSGTIQKAGLADVDVYTPNVLFFADDDGLLKLIVVDINNEYYDFDDIDFT